MAPVFPPPAAAPLTSDAAETSEVPLLLDTPTTAPAPLDMLITGMLATPLDTVTTAPVEAVALFVMAAELPAPLTRAATADLERPPDAAAAAAALALLAALITAAWLGAPRSWWCWEEDFPASAVWREQTWLSIKEEAATLCCLSWCAET